MLERIQAYFEGELHQAEKEAFEAELETNAALQAEVALYKNMKTAIRSEGMKSALEAMHVETTAMHEIPDEKIGGIKPRVNPWVWIIGLGFMFVIAWFLLRQQEVEVKETPQKTPPVHLQYAQEMQSLEGLPVTLSATTENENFAEGMVSYRRKDFARALTFFEAASEQGVGSDTLNIYLANVYLALDRDEEARELLEYIAENQRGPYYETSLWFLAKYHLKHRQIEEAKAILGKLADLRGDYAAKAEQIITSLK